MGAHNSKHTHGGQGIQTDNPPDLSMDTRAGGNQEPHIHREDSSAVMQVRPHDSTHGICNLPPTTTKKGSLLKAQSETPNARPKAERER
eukprot:1149656-Pelagomonas_calceolata.AAC.1